MPWYDRRLIEREGTGVVRRKRANQDGPREKRTVIPAVDSQAFARAFEDAENRETLAPPPGHPALACHEEPMGSAEVGDREHHRLAVTAAPPAASGSSDDVDGGAAYDDTLPPDADAETIGREMYGSYLSSDFPEALVLAERVLELEPKHALAQLVADRCRERMPSGNRTVSPSSIVRLKFAELERHSRLIDARTSYVLGHVDGITDLATVAEMSGLPGPEALDRLHALLELGVLEIVA